MSHYPGLPRFVAKLALFGPFSGLLPLFDLREVFFSEALSEQKLRLAELRALRQLGESDQAPIDVKNAAQAVWQHIDVCIDWLRKTAVRELALQSAAAGGFVVGLLLVITLASSYLLPLWQAGKIFDFVLLWLVCTPVGLLVPFISGLLLAAATALGLLLLEPRLWPNNNAFAFVIDALRLSDGGAGPEREQRLLCASERLASAARLSRAYLHGSRRYTAGAGSKEMKAISGLLQALSLRLAFRRPGATAGVRNALIVILGDMAGGNWGTLADRGGQSLETSTAPPPVLHRILPATAVVIIFGFLLWAMDRLALAGWSPPLSDSWKVLLVGWFLYVLNPALGQDQSAFQDFVRKSLTLR